MTTESHLCRGVRLGRRSTSTSGEPHSISLVCAYPYFSSSASSSVGIVASLSLLVDYFFSMSQYHICISLPWNARRRRFVCSLNKLQLINEALIFLWLNTDLYTRGISFLWHSGKPEMPKFPQRAISCLYFMRNYRVFCLFCNCARWLFLYTFFSLLSSHGSSHITRSEMMMSFGWKLDITYQLSLTLQSLQRASHDFTSSKKISMTYPKTAKHTLNRRKNLFYWKRTNNSTQRELLPILFLWNWRRLEAC